MLHIGITSASGKMGKALLEELKTCKDCKLSCAYSRTPEVTENKSDFTSSIIEFAKSSDVIIDFSSPDFLEQVLSNALKFLRPVVCGTTGLGQQHHTLMAEAAKNIPIFYAPNMSVGIHFICAALNNAKPLSANFNTTIKETHHIHKKDSPSGTALLLASKLSEQGFAVKINSIREGSVFGIHEIQLTSSDEVITISHKALSRNVFAKGAINAAIWLFKQDPGLYSFNDMFNVANP